MAARAHLVAAAALLGSTLMAGTDGGLLGHWKLAGDCRDSSGHAHHGVNHGARLGAECVVAAGSLVAEGMEIPPRSLVMGVPAKIKRHVSDTEVARLRASADHYVSFKDDYLCEGLKK